MRSTARSRMGLPWSYNSSTSRSSPPEVTPRCVSTPVVAGAVDDRRRRHFVSVRLVAKRPRRRRDLDDHGIAGGGLLVIGVLARWSWRLLRSTVEEQQWNLIEGKRKMRSLSGTAAGPVTLVDVYGYTGDPNDPVGDFISETVSDLHGPHPDLLDDRSSATSSCRTWSCSRTARSRSGDRCGVRSSRCASWLGSGGLRSARSARSDVASCGSRRQCGLQGPLAEGDRRE